MIPLKTGIRVYNNYLEELAEVHDFISLQYPRNFYEVANFEIHINRYAHGADEFQEGNIIMLGTQCNKAGIILGREISLDEQGKETENWKITGTTLLGLMNRRETVPPAHTDQDRKSGDAETVMKHYVDRHFVNPVDPNRKIPRLVIAPNQNRGGQISWESRFKKVSEELSLIGKQTGLGWTVNVDLVNKQFIFDVITAEDKTQNNLDGHNPVFFSPEYGTVKTQKFTSSSMNSANVGYVGGAGEGEDRLIEIVGSAVGFDRVETFIDARDVDTETGEGENGESLIERGERKLAELAPSLYFEAQILTPTLSDASNPFALKTPFEYEVDFNLGDRVNVDNRDWGIVMVTPITGFLEIHEIGGFRLEATFGEAQPTLIDTIDKKFKELTGVEQQELATKYTKIKVEEVKQFTSEQISAEEKARIQQAKANLETAIEHTEEYAEQKFHEGTTPPEDNKVKWIDNSNPDNIVWKAFDEATQTWVAGPSGPQGPRGLQGIQGPEGDQGLQGPAGEDGLSSYTHVAYANSVDGTSGFSITDSTNKLYIGIYVDHTAVDSVNPGDYKWTRIKGLDGEQGIPGEPGLDGKTPYLHIAYSNSIDGTVGFSISDSTGKTHIGQYTDYTQVDSTTPSDYKWSEIKGEKGEQGPEGPQGIQGPKGDTGPTGDQGEQGPPGKDGSPSYLHTAYATSSTGTSNFSTTNPDGKTYIGTYTDFTLGDSSNPADYTWAKIQGPQGPEGDQGPQGPIGPEGPRGPNIVDTNTSFGVNWLVADYIKSLNGLNVGNGQFVVDGVGNVSFKGDLTGASGTFSGTVSGGTIRQTGSSGSIVLNDDGFTTYTGSTPRIVISTESDSIMGFSPSMITFEPNADQYNFVVGTNAHGLGDGFLGFLNDADPSLATRYLKFRNGGGVIQISADSIELLGIASGNFGAPLQVGSDLDMRNNDIVNVQDLTVDFLTFADPSAINFDEYGNIQAKLTASSYADWHVDNVDGNRVLSVDIGADGKRVAVYPDGGSEALELMISGGRSAIRGSGQAMMKFSDTSPWIDVRNNDDTSFGNINLDQLSYTTLNKKSFEELKEEIEVYTGNATEVIRQSEVVQYYWKNSSKTRKETGFIWQQMPECIKGSIGLSTDEMVAFLYKGFQELDSRLTKLEVTK